MCNSGGGKDGECFSKAVETASAAGACMISPLNRWSSCYDEWVWSWLCMCGRAEASSECDSPGARCDCGSGCSRAQVIRVLQVGGGIPAAEASRLSVALTLL